MSQTASRFAPLPPASLPRAEGRLTHEDILRAEDRRKVQKERSEKHWLQAALAARRPGRAGHARRERRPQHGLLCDDRGDLRVGFFVPFILLTFLMAYVVQEMTVRLGAATHRGHAELIFQRSARSGAISPWATSCSATC